MEKIIITGHRNPDFDSVCAAYAYSKLKNKIDRSNEYIPVCCGPVPENIQKQFQLIDADVPEYHKDIYPKVIEIAKTSEDVLQCNEPVSTLINIFNSTHPSVVPVMDENNYYGLLSVDDITSWFLRENGAQRPVYQFEVENFKKVIPGDFLYKNGLKEFSAPLVAGVMEFNLFCKHIREIGNAVLVLGAHRTHIEFAVSQNMSAIVICGSTFEEVEALDIDFSTYQGTVFVSPLDSAETLRLLRMSVSVRNLVSQSNQKLEDTDRIEEARDKLSKSRLRGLPIFSDGKFAGFVTRRCFLDLPKPKLILVDHNEEEQSIEGIETANVIEIIDHHRLDAGKTTVPIFIAAEPVGSTCTIVYSLFQRYGVVPDAVTARVLLTGLLSDTVILKSPTTTFHDYTAADDLLALAGEKDLHAFGEGIFRLSHALSERDPRSVVEGDFKRYSENGIQIGIGQCEVTTLKNVDENEERLLETLKETKEKYSLDWVMLLITDVFRHESILLTTEYFKTSKFFYSQLNKNKFYLPKVLSRKKQLLPEVIRVINENN